jgi:hypothetical protein
MVCQGFQEKGGIDGSQDNTRDLSFFNSLIGKVPEALNRLS